MPPPRGRKQRAAKFVSAGWPHIPDLKGGEERATPPGAPARVKSPGPYVQLGMDAGIRERVEHIIEHLTGPCPGCNDAISLIRELEPFYQRAPSDVSEPMAQSTLTPASEPSEHASAVAQERAALDASTKHMERAELDEGTVPNERSRLYS